MIDTLLNEKNRKKMRTKSYTSQASSILSMVGIEGSVNLANAIKSSALAYESKAATQRRYLAPPSKKDARKMVPITNEILLYLSTLNLVMFDIVAEYEAAGWYRQSTKKNLNQASKRVRDVFDRVYHTIAENETDKRGTNSYNEAMLDAYNVIGAAILLETPERSWNIAMALIRLILELNDQLGNYEVVEVQRLAIVQKMLSGLPLQPNEYHLDNIIKLTLRNYF